MSSHNINWTKPSSQRYSRTAHKSCRAITKILLSSLRNLTRLFLGTINFSKNLKAFSLSNSWILIEWMSLSSSLKTIRGSTPMTCKTMKSRPTWSFKKLLVNSIWICRRCNSKSRKREIHLAMTISVSWMKWWSKLTLWPYKFRRRIKN